MPLNPVGNWYQQFMPNLNGRTISDIFFIDSLTGWAVTPYRFQNDSSYVLKTTSGGDAWYIQHIRIGRFVGSSKVKFLNANTGYTAGASDLPFYSAILKTTDGGNTWFNVNPPTDPFFVNDIHILSNDTFWVVNDESLAGGVFFTSNGGVSWVQQLNISSQNPKHIYMVNSRIGFIAEDFNYLRKTTNSGVNWTVVPGADGFLDMHFVDTLTGWKSYGLMKKTTDGGNNWITQTLPSGGQLLSSGMGKFSVLNRDTIWGVGGQIQAGVSTIRGIIFRTVDGGANWLFQTPDTTYGNFNYFHIQFTDKQHGWAYTTVKGIHTTAGGDPVWLTGITQINSPVPKEFKLYQNYPNPFNPVTNIKYSVKRQKSNVKLTVFDILGKQIAELVNQKQNAGTYQVDFSGNGCASGIYFYKLTVSNRKELFSETKKMILIK